jgi:hypothetical protein
MHTTEMNHPTLRKTLPTELQEGRCTTFLYLEANAENINWGHVSGGLLTDRNEPASSPFPGSTTYGALFSATMAYLAVAHSANMTLAKCI